MSHHQAKRPYGGSQPSIASYFLQSPSSVSPMTTYSISNFSSAAAPQPDSRSPPLPPSVQANLLSVGMRVRKSVPEGYKTGSYSSFALFSDPTPVKQIQEPRPRKTTQRSRAGELAPFCGIMKVGGMAQQQSHNSAPWEVVCDAETNGAMMDEDEYDDYDEVPALSQGSTNSDASVMSRGVGKRRFDLDEEDEALADQALFASSTRRIIAVPRRKGMARLSGQVEIFGQENRDADLDFGEADFLDYRLVDEVEMAGV